METRARKRKQDDDPLDPDVEQAMEDDDLVRSVDLGPDHEILLQAMMNQYIKTIRYEIFKKRGNIIRHTGFRVVLFDNEGVVAETFLVDWGTDACYTLKVTEVSRQEARTHEGNHETIQTLGPFSPTSCDQRIAHLNLLNKGLKKFRARHEYWSLSWDPTKAGSNCRGHCKDFVEKLSKLPGCDEEQVKAAKGKLGKMQTEDKALMSSGVASGVGKSAVLSTKGPTLKASAGISAFSAATTAIVKGIK